MLNYIQANKYIVIILIVLTGGVVTMWEWLSSHTDGIRTTATCLALLSLFLIAKQLRDTRVWNKLHFTYTFFPDPLAFETIEIFLDERVSFWKRDTPLSDLEVKALIGKEDLSTEEKEQLKKAFGPTVKQNEVAQELYEAGRKLKLYINQIESYCAAISSGIIDSESAKNIYGFKFRRAYEKSLPWIEKTRTQKNAPELYIEISKTLNKWNPQPKGQSSKY